MNRTPRHSSGERGVVLIATMILLVLLTILALAAVSMNSTQTRVATNSANQQVAYQTAEGVLNQAQNNVLAGAYPVTAFAAGTAGLYIFDPTTAPVWQTQPGQTSIWALPGKTVATSFAGGPSVSGQYVVEMLPPVVKPGQALNAQTQVYRITAYGAGNGGKSPVVLQTTMQIQ